MEIKLKKCIYFYYPFICSKNQSENKFDVSVSLKRSLQNLRTIYVRLWTLYLVSVLIYVGKCKTLKSYGFQNHKAIFLEMSFNENISCAIFSENMVSISIIGFLRNLLHNFEMLVDVTKSSKKHRRDELEQKRSMVCRRCYKFYKF